MPDENLAAGQADAGDQRREPAASSATPRCLPAVAFGLGAAVLAGIITVAGPLASPASKTGASGHVIAAADPDAAINQLINGGGTRSVVCTPQGS